MNRTCTCCCTLTLLALSDLNSSPPASGRQLFRPALAMFNKSRKLRPICIASSRTQPSKPIGRFRTRASSRAKCSTCPSRVSDALSHPLVSSKRRYAKRLPKLYARRKQLSARVSQPMYESVSTFATQRGMSICEYVARLINDHIQDQLTHARASRPIL